MPGLVKSHSDAEMLNNSSASKKATLQKLMSFDMMEPGMLDEEIMLEVRIIVSMGVAVFSDFATAV